MNEDLKLIKKHYGEKMMHLCRKLFPTILEEKGLLSELLFKTFNPSRFLYDDIVESDNIDKFRDYINSLIERKNSEKVETTKTPFELLEEAGYKLYECHTEEEIQSFKKYYIAKELLCTFNGDRLNTCYVFFAVKQNAEDIKRENFLNPERQDEYGISVISIQFSRGFTNTLSIKNRYNHTVDNPDATFSNNLENIIEGLTVSFEKEYHLNINQNDTNGFELKNYVKASDGKFYKYNYEINNIYYCPDNVIIDNFEVKKYEKEKYIIQDYFIIDLVNKKIDIYDRKIEDCFIDGLQNIDKIEIIKEEGTENKKIEILFKDRTSAIIEIDKTNKIIGYKNNNLIEIYDRFLCYNKALKRIEIDSVKKIGTHFLLYNEELVSLSLQNLEECGNSFLPFNYKISNIDFPKVKKVGSDFLYKNLELKQLCMPELLEMGVCFMQRNQKLYELIVPKVKIIKHSALCFNKHITKLNLPEVEIIVSGFLKNNKNEVKMYAPKLLENNLDSRKFQLYDSPIVSLKKANQLTNEIINEAIFEEESVHKKGT